MNSMKLTELAKRLNSENAQGLGLPPLLMLTDDKKKIDPTKEESKH